VTDKAAKLDIVFMFSLTFILTVLFSGAILVLVLFFVLELNATHPDIIVP
jgi:hypothetical protein